ncbi:MAG: carboxypeptidase-like regulatory domain-containing protein, partial [Bacteroidales bacterium]|nr:carboxypeptidase-like regulatory domain-containing protein [Bacteroidales bacterium]
MKLSKLVLTLVLFVVFQLMLMSQTRNPGVVSGRILDIHSKTPVEYANILLFDTLTGKMVTGIVSDSNGHFRLDNVPLGVFIVEYSFIGYATNRTSPVVVSRKAPGVDLGELLLDPSAFTMNEVTVTAEKATMIT